MAHELKDPWCIKCHHPCWLVKVIDGVREFRCGNMSCQAQFKEVNTRLKTTLNKIQDARWLLAGGMSLNEVARTLHCRKGIVRKAVEQYGRRSPVKTGPKPPPVLPMSEYWPYDSADPFMAAVNEVLPRTITEDVRSEVGQEMVVAMLAVLKKPAQFIRQYYRRQGVATSLDSDPKYYATLAG